MILVYFDFSPSSFSIFERLIRVFMGHRLFLCFQNEAGYFHETWKAPIALHASGTEASVQSDFRRL